MSHLLAASLGPLLFLIRSSLYTAGEWHIDTYVVLCPSLCRSCLWLHVLGSAVAVSDDLFPFVCLFPYLLFLSPTGKKFL